MTSECKTTMSRLTHSPMTSECRTTMSRFTDSPMTTECRTTMSRFTDSPMTTECRTTMSRFTDSPMTTECKTTMSRFTDKLMTTECKTTMSRFTDSPTTTECSSAVSSAISSPLMLQMPEANGGTPLDNDSSLIQPLIASGLVIPLPADPRLSNKEDSDSRFQDTQNSRQCQKKDSSSNTAARALLSNKEEALPNPTRDLITLRDDSKAMCLNSGKDVRLSVPGREEDCAGGNGDIVEDSALRNGEFAEDCVFVENAGFVEDNSVENVGIVEDCSGGHEEFVEDPTVDDVTVGIEDDCSVGNGELGEDSSEENVGIVEDFSVGSQECVEDSAFRSEDLVEDCAAAGKEEIVDNCAVGQDAVENAEEEAIETEDSDSTTYIECFYCSTQKNSVPLMQRHFRAHHSEEEEFLWIDPATGLTHGDTVPSEEFSLKDLLSRKRRRRKSKPPPKNKKANEVPPTEWKKRKCDRDLRRNPTFKTQRATEQCTLDLKTVIKTNPDTFEAEISDFEEDGPEGTCHQLRKTSSVESSYLEDFQTKAASLDESTPVKYCCVSCSYMGHSRFQFALHLGEHSKFKDRLRPVDDVQAVSRCSICGYLTTDADDLDHHFQVHEKQKMYMCLHCSEDFDCEADTTAHITNAHGPVESNQIQSWVLDRRAVFQKMRFANTQYMAPLDAKVLLAPS